jgi:hypothetical protein
MCHITYYLAYADFAFVSRGGGIGASAQLAGISRAAGVGLDEAGKLASDRPGGARQLNYEIDQLRSITDDVMAAKFAQNRGLEGYRSVRNLTDSQYESSKNAPQVSNASIVVADRAMADFNIELAKLTVTVETALTPVIAVLANEFANVFDVLNTTITNSPLYQGLKQLSELLGGGDKNPGDKMNEAADKMKDSANKISDAVYGGGARARNAVPAAYNWYPNADMVSKDIRKLGGLI